MIEMIETGYVSELRDIFSAVRADEKEFHGLRRALTTAKTAMEENKSVRDNEQEKVDNLVQKIELIKPEDESLELTEEQRAEKEQLELELAEGRTAVRDADDKQVFLDGKYDAAKRDFDGKETTAANSKKMAASSYKAFFRDDTRFSTLGSTRRNMI